MEYASKLMRIMTITIVSVNIAEIIFIISIPFIWSNEDDSRIDMSHMVTIDVGVMCSAIAIAYIAVIIYLIRPLNELS